MVLRTILFILLMTKTLQTNASGFDAYSSCYRTSRKRQDLPCDFASQTWCTIPGNSYPWHAVRRFVRENQGLMRRMYGDERHISVLRAELESNDIEYFSSPSAKEEVRQRYSKDMDGADFVKMFINAEGRKLFDEKTTKIEKIQKSIEEKSNNVLYQNQIKVSKEEDVKYSLKTNKAATTTTTTTTTSTVEPSETIPELNQTTTESSNFTSSIPTMTTDSINPTTGFSYNQTTAQNATYGDEFDYAETEETPTTTNLDGLTTTENAFEEEEDSKDKEDYVESVEEAEVEEQVVVEEQKPPQAMPMIRLKGINACPVKEEVVAPFWANNTRGEVLALLNLYPFEQYVHWEKCTYEHKQMFCREGCRCEQQYRLHRLLAYDPNNECRGIFSDWFRFPSCCVCKCYDLPMEFRLTSRSPRFQSPDYHGTLFNQPPHP